MRTHKCPRCGEMSIPLKDKYRAGFWGIVSCGRCGARLCALPALLALFFVLYVWDIMWFFGMYHFTGNWMHFFYMALGWIVIDMLNVRFVPLASMRSKPT